MAVLFTEGFESGTNGAALSTSNTTFGLINGAPTFTNAAAFQGSLSMACLTTAAAACAGRADHTATGTPWARAAFRFNAAPGGNCYLIQANNASTILADVRMNTAGTISVRNGTTAVWTSPAALDVTGTTWYQFVWQGDKTTNLQQLRVYGATGALVLDSGSVTYSTTLDCNRTYFGSSPSVAGANFLIDYVAVADTDPGIISTVTPPTVSLPDQSVQAGSLVTLSATVTDPGSAVTGVSFTQVSNGAPTVTLAGTGTTRTFTPATGHVYEFTVTVTYSGGSVSDGATVRVRDDAAKLYRIESNPGSWGLFGSAPDAQTALSDSDDATGVASPTAPSASVCTFGLTPLNAGVVSLVLRHRASDAVNVIQRKVEILRDGSTVVATETFNLPTSATNRTLATSSSQAANAVLSVRITDTQL